MRKIHLIAVVEVMKKPSQKIEAFHNANQIGFLSPPFGEELKLD
jgi:hypothetical protein